MTTPTATSELQFIQGRTAGSCNVLHNGYRLGKEKKPMVSGDQAWKCVIKYCNGRIWTRGDTLVEVRSEHNHDNDLSGTLVKAAVNELVNLAETTRQDPTVIIAQSTASLPLLTRARLPPKEALKKKVHYARRRADPRPRAPKNLAEILVQESDCFSGAGDQMLLYDNHHPVHRMIIFGTAECVKRLEQSSSWYVDGTFGSCPQLFHQIVTFHAEFPGNDPDDNTTWVFPCIWVLLTGKRGEMYEEMLSELKSLGTFAPTHIMTDFEQGLRTAINKYFLGCTLSGCYFHFSNAVKKKTFEKHRIAYLTLVVIGGAQVYSPTRIWVRRLTGLAFVPTDRVVDSFALLVEMMPEDLVTKLEDVILYFEKVWISGVSVAGRNRGCAMFPPPTWNVNQRTLYHMNRTNNHVESFHGTFNKHYIAGNGKPTIHGFIAGVKLYQSDVDTAMAQCRMNEHAPSRKRSDLENDKRIYNAVQCYSTMDLIQYLDMVMDLQSV